ncbi:MAG: transcription antitermination factor NusB [Rikenellaceae bacterium]
MLNRSLLRTKVLRSLYAHTTSETRGANFTLNEYKKSVEMCYDLHLFLLELLGEVVYYARERQKIASEKLRPTPEELNPKTRFVDNPIIESLKHNEGLQARLAQGGLSWGNHEEVIREMYNQIINAPFYASYVDGAGKDREFIIRVLTQLFDDNEVLENAIEDISILWADDFGYGLCQAVNFINESKENTLYNEFNSPEDQKFGEDLLLHAIAHREEYLELIDSLSDNWELERIAHMDSMVLVVAISELVSCPTIPTKVTLNEFIEISKYYSTSTSYNFINGVLHKAIEKLKGENKIRKTGRGLMGETPSK